MNMGKSGDIYEWPCTGGIRCKTLSKRFLKVNSIYVATLRDLKPRRNVFSVICNLALREF